MNDIRGCTNRRCGYITKDKVSTCPRCGSRIQATAQKRWVGWVVMSLGLFLVALPGVLCFYLAPSLLHPGSAEYGPVFNGTTEQGKLAIGLFGVLILFGINAAIAGVLQIRTGRRNTWTLVLGAVLLAAVMAVGGALSKSLS